jgi:hypothetical protein
MPLRRLVAPKTNTAARNPDQCQRHQRILHVHQCDPRPRDDFDNPDKHRHGRERDNSASEAAVASVQRKSDAVEPEADPEECEKEQPVNGPADLDDCSCSRESAVAMLKILPSGSTSVYGT